MGLPVRFLNPLSKGNKLFLNVIAAEAGSKDLGSYNLEQDLNSVNILFNALNKVRAGLFRSSEDDDIDYQVSTSLTADQILELEKLGFVFEFNDDGDQGLIINGPFKAQFFASLDKDDIFYFDEYYKVKHPLLDLWNNFFRFDPFSAVNYPDTIAKLRKAFGGFIKPPVYMGDLQGLALNDNIHKIDSWESYEDVVKDLKKRVDKSGDIGKNTPYDVYDEFSKDRWSSEGGFSEYIDILRHNLIHEGMTIEDAFEKINISCKNHSLNEAIKINLLSHIID
jgi:hypothetical protein